MSTLADLISAGPYQSYAYGYPHKTAWRTLPQAIHLRTAWSQEPRTGLLLYAHVPFCEQRCGFCNLYTWAAPGREVVESYLHALAHQAVATREALWDQPSAPTFAETILGGGTPTFLSAHQLERLYRILDSLRGPATPGSVEASPGTLQADHIPILQAAGVTRLSLGVQSLEPAETASVQRRQQRLDVERALAMAVSAFPKVNVDLIYGLRDQREHAFSDQIREVVKLGVTEIYLYPLYVRPETGLGRDTRRRWDDQRLALYRAGCETLAGLGWTQHTMRCFRAPTADHEPARSNHQCGVDGTVGLGPGARSYTKTLHWSTPFGVRQSNIRSGVRDWIQADPQWIRHGYSLTPTEYRRRYLILHILEGGVDLSTWANHFGADLLDQHPELLEAIELGLLQAVSGSLKLTPRGRELSDVLGDWLQSDNVRALRNSWREPALGPQSDPAEEFGP